MLSSRSSSTGSALQTRQRRRRTDARQNRDVLTRAADRASLGGMRTWVTDLRDMPPRHAAVQKAGRARADFTRDVVEAATAEPVGTATLTAVVCIAGAARNRCRARVRVTLGAAGVEWSCEACGDNGVVTGFAGSPSDLSGHAARGQKVCSGASTTRNAQSSWKPPATFPDFVR